MNNWFDIKKQKVQMFSRKMFVFQTKIKIEKKTIIHQICEVILKYGRISLKFITQILFPNYFIRDHYNHSSLVQGLRRDDCSRSWVSLS